MVVAAFAYNWCNNAGPGRGFGRGTQQAAGATPTPPPLDPGRGGIFRSENKGGSWTHVSNCNPRPMYFSQIRVDPTNDKAVYVAGLPVMKSLDGGRTFVTLDEAGGNSSPGHVDQHAIWIDPKNPKHLLIGNDGGFNVSWDQGRTWDFVNTMATATAYWVSADMRRPYYVYIGLQDNGSWGGPSATRSANGILQLRLVRHRRRRRVPDGRRSDRLQHRLHRIAGREREPLRPAQRPRAEHPPAPGGCRPRRTWWRRRGRWTRRRCAERAELGALPINTASTGTRRSSSRRTIRASSGSAATGCSSR